MTYQGSSRLGQWARQHQITQDLYRWDCDNESVHALHFYSGRIIPSLGQDQLQTGRTYRVYSGKPCMDSLRNQGLKVRALKEIPTHRVTRWTWTFLNPQTRHQVTGVSGIYEIKP